MSGGSVRPWVGLCGLGYFGLHPVTNKLMIRRFRHDELKLVVQQFEFAQQRVMGMQAAVCGANESAQLIYVKTRHRCLRGGKSHLGIVEQQGGGQVAFAVRVVAHQPHRCTGSGRRRLARIRRVAVRARRRDIKRCHGLLNCHLGRFGDTARRECTFPERARARWAGVAPRASRRLPETPGAARRAAA